MKMKKVAAALGALALLAAACLVLCAGAGRWGWLEAASIPGEDSAGTENSVAIEGEGGDYDGPLPFEGLDRPLSEMPRNAKGYIEADNGETLIDGVLYVGFGPEAGSEENIIALVESLGMTCVDPYWSDYIEDGLAYVHVPDGMSMEEAAVMLEGLDEVESVELIGPNHGRIRMFEGEEAAESGGSAGNDPQSVFPSIDMGEYHLAWDRFEEAWDVAKCEGNVTVAVVDTGAPPQSLSDLAPNVDYTRMYDATGGDGYDAVGHGTAVASIISAIADDDGCTGCSWDARILPVRIVQSEEFERADDGRYDMQPLWDAFGYLLSLEDPPDVVNMSFGGAVAKGELRSSDATRMQTYVNRLRAKGCVCVAASGNDGGLDPEHPFTGDYDNSVNYPAACSGVVSVGSLHAPSTPSPVYIDGTLASPVVLSPFSNTASYIDLVAFGDDIQALSLSLVGTEGTWKRTGTSFSAPQVASAAALVKAAHPGYGAQDVVDALTSTAHRMRGADGAVVPGTGYGALDADAAVRWVKPGTPDASPAAGGYLSEMWAESRGRSDG